MDDIIGTINENFLPRKDTGGCSDVGINRPGNVSIFIIIATAYILLEIIIRQTLLGILHDTFFSPQIFISRINTIILI